MDKPAETKSPIRGEIRTATDEDAALIPTMISSAAGVAGKTVSTAFGIVGDVRGEVVEVVGATADYMEGLMKSGLRLTRKLQGRLDGLATEVLGRGETAAVVLIDSAERTGRSVNELVTTTSRSVVGEAAA